MSGILFFRTEKPDEIDSFYRDVMGMEIWLVQAECTIYRHGNILLGFCKGIYAETQGCITFFYPSQDDVDSMHMRLIPHHADTPRTNEIYNIYQFYARDPEGRVIECQMFFDHMNPYHALTDALIERRSIRLFTNEIVPNEVLLRVFEVCRYAPTSCNSQGYYYRIVRDQNILQRLAHVRGNSSAPIANAMCAVIVAVDPQKTQRPEQDGSIAAYHFLLSAWGFGLGTCWIGGMDRDEVKTLTGIPINHYLAAVTPVGYFVSTRAVSPRRDVYEFVQGLE